MNTKISTMIGLALALSTTTALAQSTTTKAPQQDHKKSENIFRFVDQQAEPKGGMQAFQEYLAEHVSYPKEAQDNNIQGNVTVQFVVNEDGKLSDFTILKDIGGGCGEAVRKALESYSSKWTPGKSHGQAVKSYFVVPFTFSI